MTFKVNPLVFTFSAKSESDINSVLDLAVSTVNPFFHNAKLLGVIHQSHPQSFTLTYPKPIRYFAEHFPLFLAKHDFNKAFSRHPPAHFLKEKQVRDSLITLIAAFSELLTEAKGFCRKKCPAKNS
jgi:hypothetical protein